MDKSIHPILYCACDYLYTTGLKEFHVDKRGPWTIRGYLRALLLMQITSHRKYSWLSTITKNLFRCVQNNGVLKVTSGIHCTHNEHEPGTRRTKYWSFRGICLANTLRSKQNVLHLANVIFKVMFLFANHCILIKIAHDRIINRKIIRIRSILLNLLRKWSWWRNPIWYTIDIRVTSYNKNA